MILNHVNFIEEEVIISSIQEPTPCPKQNICKNNGVCSIVGASFTCNCPDGLYGSFCELECKSNGKRTQWEKIFK